MANSRYEYVKQFELDDRLLPGCWIVVRIDGKGFTKFADLHKFDKPNDAAALHLMNASAQSDEYSFLFHKSTQIYGRRASKLISLVASCFAGNYVRLWPDHLPDKTLVQTPAFDARAVCYPSVEVLRDYFSWRQTDTHINNQYNTCFWALVQSGKTPAAAQLTLKGTTAEVKNELMFSQFKINYNDLPDMFRKGSIVLRDKHEVVVKHDDAGTPIKRSLSCIHTLHCDLMRDQFWLEHPGILR